VDYKGACLSYFSVHPQREVSLSVLERGTCGRTDLACPLGPIFSCTSCKERLTPSLTDLHGSQHGGHVISKPWFLSCHQQSERVIIRIFDSADIHSIGVTDLDRSFFHSTSNHVEPG
jgi:hypothetical protein